MSVEGILPYRNSIVACADSIYFLEHGEAFIYSCRKYNNHPHIHLINPTKEAHVFAKKLKVDYTIEKDAPISETYYACSRFLVAPVLLSEHVKLLILDIDCYLNKHFEFFDDNIELGLFLRSPLANTGWLARGTKVAAGMVYITEKARIYIELVGKMIIEIGMKRWYVDQVALYEAWEILYKDTDKYIVFDEKYLDWEFTEDSIVWTGKGPRKYNDRTYVNRKRELERENSSI